jgi:hypothetical protein
MPGGHDDRSWRGAQRPGIAATCPFRRMLASPRRTALKRPRCISTARRCIGPTARGGCVRAAGVRHQQRHPCKCLAGMSRSHRQQILAASQDPAQASDLKLISFLEAHSINAALPIAAIDLGPAAMSCSCARTLWVFGINWRARALRQSARPRSGRREHGRSLLSPSQYMHCQMTTATIPRALVAHIA